MNDLEIQLEDAVEVCEGPYQGKYGRVVGFTPENLVILQSWGGDEQIIVNPCHLARWEGP